VLLSLVVLALMMPAGALGLHDLTTQESLYRPNRRTAHSAVEAEAGLLESLLHGAAHPSGKDDRDSLFFQETGDAGVVVLHALDLE
jgi:hypothetical protein